MEEIIPFEKLSDIKQISNDFGQLGSDYIFSRLTPSWHDTLMPSTPIRVSGFTLVLLLKGSLSLDINSEKMDFKAVSMLAFGSNTVIRVNKSDWSNIDAYMLFISVDFLHDLNINLNTIDFSAIERNPNPVTDNLSPDERRSLKGYMELLSYNAISHGETIYTRNAARSLIQALMYQMLQIKLDHSEQKERKGETSNSRKVTYVSDFMRLVQLHHSRERSLAFYADKLYISPKYLSRIIKEATGRSAADWIDQFVILEAKNMLRFSNKNIQQVAYALNFSTQSSFGKFFKHLTGMSPSDYQKT